MDIKVLEEQLVESLRRVRTPAVKRLWHLEWFPMSFQMRGKRFAHDLCDRPVVMPGKLLELPLEGFWQENGGATATPPEKKKTQGISSLGLGL